MREWRVSPAKPEKEPGRRNLDVRLPCGRCVMPIGYGSPYLVVTTDGGSKLLRCASCAERLFGEHPPGVIASAIDVPAPSLPLELHRGPDVVTPRQVQRSVQFNDYRSRQLGERE